MVFLLVHIELKRRGVAIREAFNQINRYHEGVFLGRMRSV
ncbi:MAG: type I restriction endonuclease [Lachnospiraceae bacterium]